MKSHSEERLFSWKHGLLLLGLVLLFVLGMMGKAHGATPPGPQEGLTVATFTPPASVATATNLAERLVCEIHETKGGYVYCLPLPSRWPHKQWFHWVGRPDYGRPHNGVD